MIQRLVYMIGLISFCLLEVHSQENEPFLTTFGSLHGLPSVTITKIAKDSSGYLWLASNIGLHKFDGKRFKTYYPDPEEPNSLPKADISDIHVDEYGEIYIGLHSLGVYTYNEFNDNFSLINLPASTAAARGNYFGLRSINTDEKLIYHNGLGVFRMQNVEEPKLELILNNPIRSIKVDSEDPGLFYMGGDSLFAFDLEQNKLTLLAPFTARNITVDEDGNVWAVSESDNRLIQWRKSDGKVNVFSHYETSEMYFRRVVVSNGEVWIATNKGVVKFVPSTGGWFNYYNDVQDENASVSAFVHEMYKDDEDRIWFSQNKKLFVIDPINQQFKPIQGSEKFEYLSAVQASDSEFIFGSFRKNELHHYNIETQEFRVISGHGKPDSLSYLFDMEIVKDEIWLFYLNGLFTYDISDRKFEPTDFGDFNSYFSGNHKKTVHKDNQDILWVKDIGYPIIFRIDPAQKTIDSIHYKISPALDNYSFVFVQDNGALFYINENIFTEIDFQNRSTTKYPIEDIEPNFKLGNIDGILVDKDIVWITAYNEIYRGKLENDVLRIIKKYSSSDMANYSAITEIIKDDDGRIIVLTNLDVKFYDQESDQFIGFGTQEGLTNIDRGARIKSLGDKLFFLSKGVTYAEKEMNIPNLTKANVSVDNFSTNGKSVSLDEEIVLGYKENYVLISFNSIDLTKPFSVEYKYRLGADKDWVFLDYDDTEVYLSGLTPGDYTFEIAAKHKYSRWSDISTLNFTINPPYFRTWWFRTLVIALISGLVFLYIKRRESQMSKISEMKKRVSDLENEALRAQMNPHFIFNSLNSIKSYIIDHEREQAADYLTDFSDLIRIILSNSRSKNISLKNEFEALALYMNIENIRLENKFEYEFINNSQIDLDIYLIPPLTLQPFIENAIWHGFIHKKNKGKLKIQLLDHGDDLQIIISDDGVGRKKSQEIEKNHTRKRSFGIMITKERLSQANDQNDHEEKIEIIDLEDSTGKATGTQIIVNIPKRTDKSSKSYA